MSLLRYVSHAEVDIDPDVAVPRWSLSEVGRRRATEMLAQPWVRATTAIISSAETKALEAAEILGEAVGVSVEVRKATGETDRSATGYVPHARHEELADLFFAHPEHSAHGWERAVDAQTRIVTALADVLAAPSADRSGAVVVVGHGGVGALLWCHLTGADIDRRHDQPGGGHYWCWDRGSGEMLHGWRPIDDIEST